MLEPAIIYSRLMHTHDVYFAGAFAIRADPRIRNHKILIRRLLTRYFPGGITSRREFAGWTVAWRRKPRAIVKSETRGGGGGREDIFSQPAFSRRAKLSAQRSLIRPVFSLTEHADHHFRIIRRTPGVIPTRSLVSARARAV